MVRLVPRAKRAHMAEIACKLVRKPTAEFLDTHRLFLLQNELISLHCTRGSKPLPWKGTVNEVYEKISEHFHVVTTRLLWSTLR